MNDNDIAETIANANPVPGVANDELRNLSPAETELCEAIMSLPTLTSTEERPSQHPTPSPGAETPRSHRRRWMLVVGASVAAGVIALAVVALPGGSRSNIAFADWSPSPQAVSPGERAAIETACADGVSEFEAASLDDALIDRRGSIAALTASGGEARLTCAAHFLDGSWYAFATGVDLGGDIRQPGLMRAWNSSGAEINVVDGFAPEAVSVEVDAPDVPTATATVVDGRYIVWLPQSFDWTDSVAGIEIRYLDATGQTLETVSL